ncbi:ABC transporter permease [Bacteroides sp.]
MKQLYYVIQTLLRGRGSNLIKVISLGLGLTMSILLFARVAFEQSFDKCFKDYDNLYQVFSIFTINGEQLDPQEQNCGPVAGAILENFPKEVEAATSLCYWMSDPLFNGSVRFEARKLVADSLFFQTMGIEVLSGTPVKDLAQKDVIYLSDRLARKMFDKENPIGKVISYGKDIELTVKGTYADIPENSTVRPEAVISLPTIWSRKWGNYSWNGGDSWTAFIRFRPGADKSVVNARMDAMIQKYRSTESQKEFGYAAFVKPIRDVYRDNEDVRRMRNIMTVLGIIILFIVSLNYVLISISSLSYRAKAIGVHKCNGAGNKTILSMFLWETTVIILFALILMGFILLNFRDFIEDTAAVKLEDLFSLDRIWVPLLTVVVLFIVGGVLPGQLFARIPVTQVFRRYTEGKKGWKRPLLFIQFAGVAFICGLMYVVMMQYYYVLNKDLGYNPKRVVVASANFGGEENRNVALNVFRDLPYVETVSSAEEHPVYGYSGTIINDESGKALFSSRYYSSLEDYPKMMGMVLKEGRMPRGDDETVVNETFAEWMHWGNNILNRTIYNSGYVCKVVGVMKDYRIGNFTNPQQPLILMNTKNFTGCVHVRLKEPFAENLLKLNKEMENAFPDKIIEFRPMEQMIKESYNSVRVFSNATMLAAITMFFVMLMGLIGYTTDEVRRRSKEIAIRKVNGSEAFGILELLVKDVLYVAVAAVVIGVGASWYINTMWMDMFAEHIPLSWAAYPLIAIVNIAVIVACILWKSWKIANENPVNSIKSE